jgi:hypothetical protein
MMRMTNECFLPRTPRRSLFLTLVLERKVENAKLAFSVLEWAGNMTDQPHSGCKRGLLRHVLGEIVDRQFKILLK